MKLATQLSQLNTIHQWWQPRERVLVAVSTGVDSMVLLDLLQQLPDGPQIVVAHVNHQLREQSQVEEEFLTHYCQQRQLPLVIATWNKNEHPVTGVEEAARQFRYHFFEDQMKQQNITKVLTAHHQGDQVETVLMHLTRGGQLAELTGMADRRPLGEGQLLRPLLTFSKAELRNYAIEQHLTWYEDETNQQLEFTRNRYRNELIPQLEEENPQAAEHIANYANQLAASLAALSSLLRPLLNQAILKQSNQRIELDLVKLRETMPAQTTIWVTELLISWLHLTNVNQRLVQELTNVVEKKSGKYVQLNLPNGWLAIRNYDRLVLERVKQINGQENQQTKELVVELNQWYLGTNHSHYGIFSRPNIVGATKLGNLSLQASDFPLIVRPVQSGDVIAVKGGHQKVTRTLINRKIPKPKRKQVQVLVNQQQEILAVVGVQVAYQEQSNGDNYGLFEKQIDFEGEKVNG